MVCQGVLARLSERPGRRWQRKRLGRIRNRRLSVSMAERRLSLLTANTRREALVQLDEWAAAHPSQLFPVDSCMVDFRLNDMGEIELGQFGEETEYFIWETCYPELRTVLANVIPEDGGEYTAEAKESIRQAVQHERARLWKNQPEGPQAETEIGRTLQKALRTVGPVADYYVQAMAHRSSNQRRTKPESQTEFNFSLI